MRVPNPKEIEERLHRLERAIFIDPSGASLPPQTGHIGEFLTTDGSSPSWTEIPAGGTTLYTGDGALSGNRTVTLGANTLNFTGSAGSAINITVDDITIIGDIQYNGNAKLLSNITMNLDGHLFEMLNAEGIHGVFVADATVGSERTYIQATNDANGGSFALLSGETNETQTLVTLQSDFQDGTKDAQLVLRTASGESTITYTADTHTFNAGITTEALLLNGTQFFASMKGADGTAQSSLSLFGDLVGTNVAFSLQASDGNQTASIVGNGIDNTITHTADSHTFNVEDQFLVTDGSGSFFSTTKLSTVVSASDGTALSSLTVQGDALDPSVRFTLSSNNGVGNPVSIEGSGQTSTITYTADTYTFNGGVVNMPSMAVFSSGVQSSIKMRSPDNTLYVITVQDGGTLQIVPD